MVRTAGIVVAGAASGAQGGSGGLDPSATHLARDGIEPPLGAVGQIEEPELTRPGGRAVGDADRRQLEQCAELQGQARREGMVSAGC